MDSTLVTEQDAEREQLYWMLDKLEISSKTTRSVVARLSDSGQIHSENDAIWHQLNGMVLSRPGDRIIYHAMALLAESEGRDASHLWKTLEALDSGMEAAEVQELNDRRALQISEEMQQFIRSGMELVTLNNGANPPEVCRADVGMLCSPTDVLATMTIPHTTCTEYPGCTCWWSPVDLE